jgi:hypothetical protein
MNASIRQTNDQFARTTGFQTGDKLVLDDCSIYINKRLEEGDQYINTS